MGSMARQVNGAILMILAVHLLSILYTNPITTGEAVITEPEAMAMGDMVEDQEMVVAPTSTSHSIQNIILHLMGETMAPMEVEGTTLLTPSPSHPPRRYS